jgi:transcriptional regulator with XRE-family HTH domain
MESHQLKAKDLVDMLGVSKSYVSEILNYTKGFSKVVIRKLAIYFKVSQEAFNRPYVLKAIVVSPRLAKLGAKLESIVVSPRIELGSSV